MEDQLKHAIGVVVADVGRIDAGLWPSQRQRLLRRWLDRCVRELLPVVLDNAGRSDQADLLRHVPPIVDDVGLRKVLDAARAIAPESFKWLDVDHDSLVKSVPSDAFTVPHVPSWTSAIREPYDQTRFAAGVLLHAVEHQRPLWFVVAAIMMIAGEAGSAPEMAERLVAEAHAIAGEQ